MENLVRVAVLMAVAGNLAMAQQSTITVIAPGGARAMLERMGPEFERATGNRIQATIGSGLGTKQDVAKGEVYDVAILQPPYPEVLASGNVVADSATPLASVAVGVAVKKGGVRPDISTPEAVKRTLLGAKSIAYPDPTGGAAAGVSFDATLRKLGIWEAVQPKLRRAQGGAGAMAMTARGEAEIGLTFLTEMQEPGVEVVGALPVEISTPTRLVGLIGTRAKDRTAAKALLEFLASPGAAKVYRGLRMQPAR